MLKEKREAAGFSQSQLAKKSGISVRTLQDYEQGKTDINKAKIKTLLYFIKALDCNISDIIEDKEIINLLKELNAKLK